MFSNYYLNILEERQKSNEIVFIWNDDEESIPEDGSLIKIEFTDENSVYIGPTDKVFKGSLYKEHINQTHKD